MVLWSHGFALIGVPETPIFGTYPGGIGVDIFFAISGYLNTQSLLRGQSWWRFLIRRARRIYPPVWLQPPIDISYGIYLFAFPVQQLIASCGLSFWPSLTLSLAVTTPLAILSAFFIEQPALTDASRSNS